MRWVAGPLLAAPLLAALPAAAPAQQPDALRFDRPVLTAEGAVLCARQGDIGALRRAQEAGDRAEAERIAQRSCQQVGPDVRLSVVRRPGLYDPDVEVRVTDAPDLDPGLPRGRMWTLKSMVRNSQGAGAVPPAAPR